MSTVVCPQCANPCEQAHKFCPVCGFPISEFNRKSEDPLIGTTLPGNYVLLELVGVGGMGRVYRAEQKALGRTVAVKIIHPHLLGDESASVRFITEARAASRLNHPNSVGVIDFGKNGGQLYLVMEFLRGRDLARVVYEDGWIAFRRIVDVLCQVLTALAEAHHLGIIHRDLKPENIVLEPMRSGGDFVKVVDFGLAKMKADIAGSTNITSPGIVCGTPDYMAPEQGRGDPIDARSDLYACGVILFQLLTGRLPFEAESPTQVVLMHLSLPPPNPATVAPERDIPDALVDVCLKALQKDASRRYQTADEFADALRSALGTFETPSGRFTFAEATVICGACRAIIPRSQKFCGECGARIGPSQPAAAPARAAPVPVRRNPTPPSGPRLPLPLAAREADLAWLESCRADVQGSVIAARIVGEHGVGKTRLLKEFLQIAAAEGDVVIETAPDPWSAEVGYYALRRAIAGLAELPLDGGTPPEWNGATPEARRGLMEIFGKGERSSETRRHVWSRPTAGTLSPEDRRFIAAEALRWALARAHQGSPRHRVILAIDDLHAVDGASRNAFSDVIAEPPLAALLIVATHAPGFEPAWGGCIRTLVGLPTETAASLLKGKGSINTDLHAANAKGASGLGLPGGGPPDGAGAEAGAKTVPPLYIDQLVRYSMEGGSDPPARMADLVAARIERLPQDARRTLQALAVLGDAADTATLRRLLPDIASFDELIATLAAAGMIEERPAPSAGRGAVSARGARVAGSSGIRTTHPLLRDVTLATIPAGVRRDLHAKAPFDDAGDPLGVPLEVQAIHAYHAQNAFEALMLLEQVADRAAARGDTAGSVLALRRGLDLARREIFRGELDDPMRAVLIFSRKLGEALARAGDLTDADGVLREALDLAGPGGPDRAIVLGSLAFVSRERERASEASVFLREAIDIARQGSEAELIQSLDRMRREWLAR